MSLTGINHNLHWSEFQIVEQRPSGALKDAEVAISLSNVNWRTAHGQSGDCEVVSVNASVSVEPHKCWVVKGKKGIYLRHHEQGLYDITAIGVREMYNRIKLLVKTRCEDINQEAHRIQREIQQLVEETKQRYELQTNYGNNLNLQKAWEAQLKVVKLRNDGVLLELPK